MRDPAEKDLAILAFAAPAEFAAWLVQQPAESPGAWLKFAKKGCVTPTMAKSEAIDIALCHGWIDGQLKGLDDAFFLTRFTPRKPASIWSQNNRDRALALITEGRMRPSGLAAIEKAKADGRWDKAYAPQSKAEVPEDLKQALSANEQALRFFETLSGANRYAILHRLHHAGKPHSRAKKLAAFVAMLARGETIHPQKRDDHGDRPQPQGDTEQS